MIRSLGHVSFPDAEGLTGSRANAKTLVGKVMCQIYGEQLTLANELSFALQFSRMNIERFAP